MVPDSLVHFSRYPTAIPPFSYSSVLSELFPPGLIAFVSFPLGCIIWISSVQVQTLARLCASIKRVSAEGYFTVTPTLRAGVFSSHTMATGPWGRGIHPKGLVPDLLFCTPKAHSDHWGIRTQAHNWHKCSIGPWSQERQLIEILLIRKWTCCVYYIV